MINFISGRARTGKTYRILHEIKKDVECGNNPVLILPESFSFEGEKTVLKFLGDKNASKVSVLSFKRLYDTVGSICGGICGKTLNNSDKVILMNRAVKQVAEDLKLWGRYASSSSFSENALKTIDEFRTNAITADELKNCFNSLDEGKLSAKIYDISLIYEAYIMLLGTNFIDPSDNMDKLCLMLDNCDYFKGKSVFFDGFKVFTGQQLKIISKIVSKANNVTFSFIDDKDDLRNFSLISNIITTKNKVRKICENHNKKVNDIWLPDKHYFDNENMNLVESLAFGKGISYSGDNSAVTVCKAESIFDESIFVARTIKKIIRETGCRYSDFLIVARNPEDYEDALEFACKNNGVKCFIDKKTPLSSTPVSTISMSAIDYIKKPILQNILNFLKSGISVLKDDEISEIENYAYIWNLKGSDFNKNWSMNPLGFTDKKDENFESKLNELNCLRNKAIKPLLEFKDNFKGTVKNRCKAIFDLLKAVEIDKVYLSLCSAYTENGNYTFADVIKQSYDDFTALLDSMVRCFPDVTISDNAFADSLIMALKSQMISVIPQTLDEAIFSGAEHLRQEHPKYVFIMGANSGIFPRAVKTSGIFTNSEISKLKDTGLNLSNKTLDFAIDEELLVYSNISCASSGVFLSYSTVLADGSEGSEAPFVSEFVNRMNIDVINEPAKLEYSNLPETTADTFNEFCRRFNENSEKNTLESVLNFTGYKDDVYSLNNAVGADFAEISKETAEKLYGKSLKMSPTKFDTYNRCKFCFFCKNALKAQKLYPADFDTMQRGTLIHYVLQRIIETYRKDVAFLDDEKISIEVDRFVGEYLDSISGYADIENERLKYLVSTMRRSLKYVVKKISMEFKQSDFEPVECELKIGKGEDIPEISVDLEDGKVLKLNGTVDRLDVYKGYVRIVDYKTGSKSFKLPDILFGQNMQMLLYLYSVVKSGKFGDTSAGILYMHAKRENKGNINKRMMNGLILADSELVNAMDKENKGEFIPRYKEDNYSDSFLNDADFQKVFDYTNKKLKIAGNNIFSGKIDANPIDGLESSACDYCDFASVCRVSLKEKNKVPKLSNADVIKEIEKEEGSNEI